MKTTEIKQKLKEINKHFFLVMGDGDYNEDHLITIRYIKDVMYPYYKHYDVSIIEFDKDNLYDFYFNYQDADSDETPFSWNKNKERYKLTKLVIEIIENGIDDIENI